MNMLNMFTVINLLKYELTQSINGQFSKISSQNIVKLQSVIYPLDGVVKDIQNYMSNVLSKVDNDMLI